MHAEPRSGRHARDRQVGAARQALHRHLVRRAPEQDAATSQREPITTAESAVATVTDWGPAEASQASSTTVELTNGVAVCDCPGFTSEGNCKHGRDVIRRGA